MGKAKNKSNKKGSFSDHVRSRQNAKKSGAAQSVRTNPFEIKINKQKHMVIGKNLTKFDKGVPGISRSRAIKKVSLTLSLEISSINFIADMSSLDLVSFSSEIIIIAIYLSCSLLEVLK